VALAGAIMPWSGVAYRHLPVTVDKAGVLDFSYAGRSSDNRWNVKGEPTLYLASNVGVMLAEWARHFVENRNPTLERVPLRRTVWRLTLRLAYVLDLRDAQVWTDLHLTDAPTCFLDKDYARAVAGFVRRTTPAQALLVPSVALLDRLDLWNLVLFLDKLPADPRQFITAVRRAGTLAAPHGLVSP
jgi:RES domain-containing protein